MKLKLDENIPRRVQDELAKLGHDIDTVYQENLTGCTDDLVWQAAQESMRFLVTQDLGFSNIERYKPGTHAGLLIVRLRNASRNELVRRIFQIFNNETVETWSGCFVVVTERKIRIRRPNN